MYAVQIDHRVFDQRTDGSPIGLVEALREIRGCGNAHILRLDGTLVVPHAGRDRSPLTHAPSGRTVHRRPTRSRTA